MAPSRVEFEYPNRDPEVLWVDPGHEDRIGYVKPAEVRINCEDNDNSSTVLVEGNEHAVTVMKYPNGSTQGIKQELSKEIRLTDNESLQVTSPFFSESLRISHIKSRIRKYLGKVPA